MKTKENKFMPRFNRGQATALLALFLLAWHPAFLGSETLTLTTYYPAPYGGYVSLLTTQRTLLARDSGTVGIRTGAAVPDAASSLQVNSPGGTAVRWQNSNTGAASMLNTDQGGSIELGQVGGGTPFIDFHWGGGGDFNTRIINDANGRLSISGNLNMSNNGASITGSNMSISGLCTWRPMAGTGWSYCVAGENMVNANFTNWVSEWACIGQKTASGGASNLDKFCIAGTKTTGLSGNMLCCRIQ